jgi:polysaccharide chain length determinant protein (PEP-CTERM system associated)
MHQKQNEVTKYLKIIFRHRYLFVSVSLLVMTAITAYSYLMPEQYQSDSTVFIEKNIINNLVKGIAMTPDLSDKIKVLKFALLSRDIVTKVLEDIDSDIFTKSKSERQHYITNLRERIMITVKGEELFIVSLIDSDPKFAQEFINTLVSKYVEENVSAKREESYGANRFLVEQLDTFKAKLDQAETAIIDFRKKQGVYLSMDERTDLAEIKQFMREIEDIELQLQTLKARQGRLIQQLDSLDKTVDIFSEAGGGGHIVQLERRLGDLLLRYTENYPEVVRLKAELEGLKNRAATDPGDSTGTTRMTSLNPLYQEVQQKMFEVETEISSFEAKKKNLKELVTQREKNLHEVPVNKKELAVLIQERDSHREIYQELLKRMGQSEVSKQMEISDKTSTFRIVDPANYPEIPVSPNMVKMIFLAIFGGLGCGLGAVVLLDYFDTSVNDPQQLEELGVEVLAMIPNIADGVADVQAGKRDRTLYVAGTLYLSGFVVLLIYEALHRYK